jgi:hypothetical protein
MWLMPKQVCQSHSQLERTYQNCLKKSNESLTFSKARFGDNSVSPLLSLLDHFATFDGF